MILKDPEMRSRDTAETCGITERAADSSGLHVLLDVDQLAVQAGKTLVLAEREGLLDLVDEQYPRAERPTRLLRRLQDFAAARAAGAAKAAEVSRTGHTLPHV
ncbi:hypothetical protein ACFW7J_09595 [Streptomyces sp. NPDC059525]|uniref:hypothetical protein n=1 Tax=Streptomyces sp. NPDC059525 TaxID=3346857 RepID=UPI0036A07E0A